MASREWMIVKSTLDRLVNDAVAKVATVTGAAVAVSEVEDVSNFESVLKNSAPAVLYQLLRLNPSPRAPRYEAVFNVGVKTTDDAGNYNLALMLGELQELFKQESRFTLHDYSEAGLETAEYGAMMVTDADVNPQQFDKQSGIRTIGCKAAVLCHGG